MRCIVLAVAMAFVLSASPVEAAPIPDHDDQVMSSDQIVPEVPHDGVRNDHSGEQPSDSASQPANMLSDAQEIAYKQMEHPNREAKKQAALWKQYEKLEHPDESSLLLQVMKETAVHRPREEGMPPTAIIQAVAEKFHTPVEKVKAIAKEVRSAVDKMDKSGVKTNKWSKEQWLKVVTPIAEKEGVKDATELKVFVHMMEMEEQPKGHKAKAEDKKAAKKEVPEKKAVKKEAVKKEAAKKEAKDKPAVKKEVPEKKGKGTKAVKKEAAEKEAKDKPAVKKEVPEKKAKGTEAVKKEAAEKEAKDKPAVKKEVPEKKAKDNNEAGSEKKAAEKEMMHAKEALHHAIEAAGGVQQCGGPCKEEAAVQCRKHGSPVFLAPISTLLQEYSSRHRAAMPPKGLPVAEHHGECDTSKCNMEEFENAGGCQAWHSLEDEVHKISVEGSHPEEKSHDDMPKLPNCEHVPQNFKAGCEAMKSAMKALVNAISAAGGVKECKSSCQKEAAEMCNSGNATFSSLLEAWDKKKIARHTKALPAMPPAASLTCDENKCSMAKFKAAGGCQAMRLVKSTKEEIHELQAKALQTLARLSRHGHTECRESCAACSKECPACASGGASEALAKQCEACGTKQETCRTCHACHQHSGHFEHHQATRSCEQCVEEFDHKGGCEAWHEGDDPMKLGLVPEGCMHCALKAAQHCGIHEVEKAADKAAVVHAAMKEVGRRFTPHTEVAAKKVAEREGKENQEVAAAEQSRTKELVDQEQKQMDTLKHTEQLKKSIRKQGHQQRMNLRKKAEKVRNLMRKRFFKKEKDMLDHA